MSGTGFIAKPEDLRIIHMAGPGDACQVLRNMANGLESDDVSHVAYSRLVFEVARDLGAHLLSVSTHGRRDDFTHGRIRAVSRPDPTTGKSGIGFHLANIRLAMEVRRDVTEFGANVLVSVPSPYPFLIESLASRGVKIVPALHAILWPEFRRPTLARRLAVQLCRRFYSSTSPAILTHPGGAVRQVLELTGGQSSPLVEFLPLFRRGMFAQVQPPRWDTPLLRVITVGRVEPDKGIYALIDVARRIRQAGKVAVHFDVCGTGSALDEARRQVTELGLDDTMVLHGWTEMDQLKQLWSDSHVAVVPTTSDFVEGFNQVVVEAILAGRPVITSRVCPALDYVRPCAIEVDVDDVAGYVNAITKLAAGREHYLRLQSKTGAAAAQFFDERNSFGAALRHVLKGLMSSQPVRPVALPPKF